MKYSHKNHGLYMTLRKEIFILRIYVELLMRNFKKYFKIASVAYFLPLFGVYSAMRPTYFFCRKVDDIVDGEGCELPNSADNIQRLFDRLRFIIDGKDAGFSDIELVLINAIKMLENVSKIDDDIRKDFKNFLIAMRIEYERKESQKLLSKSELDELYDSSFSSVINLALIGLKSENRVSNVENLGRLQGKVYAIRDLEFDLNLGIINIPVEIIKESSLSLQEILENPQIIFANDVIINWRKRELKECNGLVLELRQVNLDNIARKMVNFLINPLDVFIENELDLPVDKQIINKAKKYE
jgi:Squalene/phytoene synthase